MAVDDLKPGARVRVTQTIQRRDGDWHTQVVGHVQSVELGKTGSWYAHSKDDKLWLQRIRLLKDDGEITTLNVDAATMIERLA